MRSKKIKVREKEIEEEEEVDDKKVENEEESRDKAEEDKQITDEESEEQSDTEERKSPKKKKVREKEVEDKKLQEGKQETDEESEEESETEEKGKKNGFMSVLDLAGPKMKRVIEKKEDKQEIDKESEEESETKEKGKKNGFMSKMKRVREKGEDKQETDEESEEESETEEKGKENGFMSKMKRVREKEEDKQETVEESEEESETEEKEKQSPKKMRMEKQTEKKISSLAFDEDDDDDSEDDMELKYDSDGSLIDDDGKCSVMTHPSKCQLSPEEKQKLKDLCIQLKHNVLPQHKIEKIAGTRALTKEEKAKFEKYAELRTGKYLPRENKILRRNWKDFCIENEWNVNNPSPFLQMRYKNKVAFIDFKERKKFIQFLANGLNNRSLYSVFNRFKVLYEPHKVSRYSTREDDIIIEYVRRYKVSDHERDRKFAELASILKRTRASVWRRYRVLKRKRNIQDG